MKIIVFSVMFTLILIGTLTMSNINSAKAEWTGTVHIMADGSINPADAPIITYDNITYTLIGNIISSTDGIVILKDRVKIKGNGYELQGSVSGNGIRCFSLKNVTIQDITIKFFQYGIAFEECSNVTISENCITNNREGGIWLRSSTYGNIFKNNITNNGCGIVLEFSSKISIYENIIIDNNYGIALQGSESIKVFHNDFINNGVQAYSSPGSANIWDDGYPSGGNYWSNYIGVDEKSGPYQNQPGSDSIGDTPYPIDTLNKDSYPFMEPYVIPEFPLTTILLSLMILSILAVVFAKKNAKMMARAL